MESRRRGGGWRDVDICNLELSVGDVDFDDEDLGDVVVDWRRKLLELDGVVDESDETPTTAHAILPDDCIAGEGRKTRVCPQFRFLDARNEYIMTRKKVV